MSRDREEGMLGSERASQLSQAAVEAYNLRISATVQTINSNPDFMLWVAILIIKKCGLVDVVRTSNGGDLQYQAGARAVGHAVVQEFERHCPGFLERALTKHRLFEQELRQIKPKEGDNDNPDE